MVGLHDKLAIYQGLVTQDLNTKSLHDSQAF